MDKNPPANAGDTGSILGLGIFHINAAPNPCTTAAEPMCCNYGSLRA